MIVALYSYSSSSDLSRFVVTISKNCSKVGEFSEAKAVLLGYGQVKWKGYSPTRSSKLLNVSALMLSNLCFRVKAKSVRSTKCCHCSLWSEDWWKIQRNYSIKWEEICWFDILIRPTDLRTKYHLTWDKNITGILRILPFFSLSILNTCIRCEQEIQFRTSLLQIFHKMWTSNA